MYGVITRTPEELDWPEFDRGFYEVKDVTGRASDPVPGGASAVSCFGDNAAAEGDPSLVPVTAGGERATREREYFDWSYVCPSHDSYREGLLELIGDCAEISRDVRLEDVGFPRAEYCHCEACEERFAASGHDERRAWRADLVTGFVEEAAARVPDELYLTVHPDPYPGHLHERSGIDLDALAPLVDEFVVPLYDTAYGTTYWIEAIASGFADRLETRLGVELYAPNVEVAALVEATEVAEAYADAVYFGYDAGTARAVIRRLDAEGREGATYGR